MGVGYGNYLHIKLAANRVREAQGLIRREQRLGQCGGHEVGPPFLPIFLPGCAHSVLRSALPPQVRVGRVTCVLGRLGESPHGKTQAIPYPNLLSRQ